MANIIFQLNTLVDITRTGVIRGDNDPKRNQQRNFETVLQILGLRTQPMVIRPPEATVVPEDMIEFWFGDVYHDMEQRVWTMYFSADRPDAYADSTNPVGHLLSDFEQVPIITGLDETARFLLPIFYPHGAIKNIHLMLYPNK